jgi:hypothetical protein
LTEGRATRRGSDSAGHIFSRAVLNLVKQSLAIPVPLDDE